MKTFKAWFEARLDQAGGVKATILSFLHDQLNIRDDMTILSMKTTDMEPSALSKLLGLGLVNTADPDILNRARSGMTIQELIDALSEYESGGPSDMTAGF